MKIAVITLLQQMLLLTNYSLSLNILGIFPYEGKSHFFIFRVYLRELARRGHNVTVISYFPEKDAPQNYQDINLDGGDKAIGDDVPFENSYAIVLLTSLYLAYSGTENCEVMLANKQVQKLIKDKPKFDVIVVEQFNSDCALGVAYKLEAPVVGMTSHVLMPYHYRRLGVPNNPAYVPFHFFGGGTKPTLYQRMERAIFDIYFRLVYYFFSQRVDQNTLAKYFDDIPPLEDLAGDIKFLLLYHNFVLTGSRLFPSNVIEVGGYHVVSSKPLTGSLEKFFDGAEHGVIYISFGSVIKTENIPTDKVQAILDVTKELPQKFVWKWQDDTLVFDKNKLYTAKWLPQIDILGHPKTLAFISHAGNGGTTEAVHYGVPMVVIPVMGDQPSNAAAIEESGFGVQLNIKDINKEKLLSALKKVLNPKFRQKAKAVSTAWHDRPMSPLDTAVFWTEFTARHHNFTFRTAAADVPYYQHFNIDIAIVLIGLICLLLILFYKIIYITRICTKSRQNNNKTPKKKFKKA